jgi:hypothetical protein
MDNPEILETLVTQDTGHTIGSKQTLDKTARQSRMDNPDILETLITQDTGHTIPMFPVSLDCSFFIVARFCLMFIYYLLYVLCLV